MRLSADPQSRFHRLPLVHVARVFLDGQEQKRVIELDTVEGWIIRVVTEQNGKLVSAGDEVATEKLFGRVMITLPEKGSASCKI